MYEGEWERRSDNTIKTLGTDKKQLNTKVDEPYSNISAKDLVLFRIRTIRTSRVSRDFGTCVSVSVLCFDRFFRRLLFFSLQLIATNSLAKGISLTKETDDYVGSLLTLRLIWQTRKQNRRTLIPTLSYWSHTSKWRPAFPTCQSILHCKGLWLFQLRKRVYVVCERSGTDNVRAPYLNSFRKNKINFKFLPCWSACVYLLPLIFLIILSLFVHLSVSLLILLLALQRHHRQLQQQQKKLSACHFKINLLLVLLVCFARFVHSRRLSYFPISTKHYADCIW